MSASHCNCVSDMNARLRAEYNGILVTTLFGSPPKASVEVVKLDAKSRKKPPRVIASYCPFCGESYAALSSTPAEGGSVQEGSK